MINTGSRKWRHVPYIDGARMDCYASDRPLNPVEMERKLNVRYRSDVPDFDAAEVIYRFRMSPRPRGADECLDAPAE